VADLGRFEPLALAVPAGAGRSAAPCSFETASALSTQSEKMSTGSVKSTTQPKYQSGYVPREKANARCGTHGVHGFGMTVRRFYMIDGLCLPSCLSCTRRTSRGCRICRRIAFLATTVIPVFYWRHRRTYQVGRVFLTLMEVVSGMTFFACPWVPKVEGCKNFLKHGEPPGEPAVHEVALVLQAK
jgi:hypothetical protein